MKNDPTDHKLPEAIVCPSCGAKNDGALNVDNPNMPHDGDFSICVYCRELAVFVGVNGVMGQRLPTDMERVEAMTDAAVARAYAAMNAVDTRNRRL